MAISVYGSKAARTFENKMLREFVRRLLTPWSGEDRNITLVANSLWNAAEIDLVCLLPSGVLLVDFKDYAGHVTGKENGPWMLDGNVEVRGGNKANPFHQLRDNKFAVMHWLKDHALLEGRDLGRIGAAVVFSGPVTRKLDLSESVRRWFHVTDFDHCANLVSDFAAPNLDVYQRDVAAIIAAAGVEPMPDAVGIAPWTAPEAGQNGSQVVATEAGAVTDGDAPMHTSPPTEPAQEVKPRTSLFRRRCSGLYAFLTFPRRTTRGGPDGFTGRSSISELRP